MVTSLDDHAANEWCGERGVPLIVLHDWNLDDVRRAVAEFCTSTTYHVDGEEQSEWGMAWLRP